MAVAFSQNERLEIQRSLKAAARQCAMSMGVRKTTVDQLAQAADISKGAFYNFYRSKEELFLEVLEDMHTAIYDTALSSIQANGSLPDARRASEAILAACRVMGETGMMDFIERDVSYILRKLPPEVKESHYHSDVVHIKDLLECAGLTPRGGMEFAAATVRALILTVSHRADIGECYPQVLDALVCGACDRLFPAQ